MPHRQQTELEREIREQPEVLTQREAGSWETARRAAALLAGADVFQIVIAARGSSDNAGRFAQYLIGSDARVPVALATPWLYEDERPPLLRGAAVLAISQSGQSPDVVSVVRAARAQGRPCVAITNDTASPLALAADLVVPLLAGEERSVAATKTYLASLHAIAQISTILGNVSGRDGWFAQLPSLARTVVEQQLEERRRFDRLAQARSLTAVGRGLQLSTAYETALKLRELGGLMGEAFSLPDLLHGPLAALRGQGAIWLLSIGRRRQPSAQEFELLRGHAGLSVAVSDHAEVAAAADIGIQIPELPGWLTPLLAAIPAQAAGLRLAELRGGDVDRPEGLSKVTLTH
ncbi:MAG: SIS domain-containing protein [Solirubrobacteraceae bacterium]